MIHPETTTSWSSEYRGCVC